MNYLIEGSKKELRESLDILKQKRRNLKEDMEEFERMLSEFLKEVQITLNLFKEMK